MEGNSAQAEVTLVFVYNADSGVFSTLTDVVHKMLSPETYQCNLCALTHSTLGMRKEWKEFVERLDTAVEFLHADELKRQYGMADTKLPAVFRRDGETLRVLVDADSINACATLDDLKRLIVRRALSGARAA